MIYNELVHVVRLRKTGNVNWRIIRVKRITYKGVLFLLLCISLISFTGCAKRKKNDLSKYLGNTLEYFINSTNVKVTYQTEGYYQEDENRVQIEVDENNVRKITMLSEMGGYSISLVAVNDKKKKVEKAIKEEYPKEPEVETEEITQRTTYRYENETTRLEIIYNKNNQVISVSKELIGVSGTGVDKEDEMLINPEESILSVGDIEVSGSEAMVYLKAAQKLYEGEYGDQVWSYDLYGNGTTLGALLKQDVLKQMIEVKIICAKAKQQDIILSDDEVLQVKQNASDFMKELTTREQTLYGISNELATTVFADNLLAKKAYETATIDVNTEVSDEEAKQIQLWKIFLRTYGVDSKGNRTNLTEKEAVEVKERMKKIYKEAKKVEDLYAFAKGKSEDDTIEYVVGYQDLPEELRQIAFSLKSKEMSKIIETPDGYVLLYCASDYDEDATLQMKEKIIEKRRSELFVSLYKEWSKEFNVKVNENAWSKIKLTTITKE